ncbi:maleylpyruvate isomerase family mycothiol-dependent enzyme [Gordonia sp. ABSL49_1]|uniref:maleylpyruvate isomerase family mycothiol-dependent enzyme n=1 Tax=Gordonia sp. ABSL49_1 TaxID=2920941 RepID=UPI001F0F7ABC|nr:maleylpyruvate isomerase family mycothiol-dependent enzyme [Gordonia sp. ABSL49_1]MCH5645389.1 maleylpyruvate isomerase family mycothiol-dependent enzyme [Gordonia sp. ABSL49_1]
MATTILPIGPVTEGLVAAWAGIRGLAETMDADQWGVPSVLPGWTNADIVAHIIGTESLLAGRDVAAVDVSALAHVRNPIGELNEKWVEHFRGQPRADVLAAFDEIVALRTEALAAMGQNDFDAASMTPAGPDTYGRFMRIRIFDCWMHEIDLSDGIGVASPADTGAAQWAIAEIAASLPFVVGKRAGAPAGTSVLFRITGAAPTDVRIVVAERAVAVDEFEAGAGNAASGPNLPGDDAATVRLTLDAIDLARLAGGRRDADPAAVTVEGDREIADRILTNLNYVI